MKDWFAQKLKQENKQKNCCMAENCHEQVQNDKLGKIQRSTKEIYPKLLQGIEFVAQLK